MTGTKRDYGTSTFILASDDPQTTALFGTVVAPDGTGDDRGAGDRVATPARH